MAPSLFSVFRKVREQPLFRPLDEQLFFAMASIARLQNRECFILAGDMKAPALIRTPDVNHVDISRVCTEISTDWYQDQSGLALPLNEAIRRLAERDQKIYSVRIVDHEDVPQPRRRITSVQRDERAENLM